MKNKTLLLLSFFLTFSSACFAQEPSVPTRELKIGGLQQKVTVRRDGRGIPFVEAQSEADLYFAQGFVTAQDRLWQMDLFRRVARGELSEIFGATTLEGDRRWRKYNFAALAPEILKRMQPDARAALESYTRGVNAFIRTLDDNSKPIEFRLLQYKPREWTPEDSIVTGKILAEGLSSTWREDIARAQAEKVLSPEKFAELFNLSSPHDVLLVGADTAAKKPQVKRPKSSRFASSRALFDELARDAEVEKESLARVGLYAEDLAASNNWVVAGKRTADGKPLLANDPHLQPSAPAIWYMIHLSAPGLRVAGVTVVGAPGVVIGHNENIAWGLTNVGPDVQDLYLERFDAKNPNKYQTPNGLTDAKVRREEIKVRESPLSPATRSEFLEITETRHGVIFLEADKQRYALKWTAFDAENNELEAFYALNKAKNWNDFRASLKLWGGAMQNFVYADVAGNIGWIAAGRIPVRKSGDGRTLYDGSTDAGEWTGYIPFDQLPQLYNPPDGLIVTANQRTIGKSFPHQSLARDFAAPFRARRIYDLLNVNPKLTAENFNDVQRDTFNIMLSRLAREIVNNKAASTETLEVLSGWDGRMNADSRAALLINEIQREFRRRVFAANAVGDIDALLSNEAAFIDWVFTVKPTNWKPKEFADYNALFKKCDEAARQTLTQRYGADAANQTWGAANKISFNHPLAAVPLIGGQFAIPVLPLNGSAGSPNVGGYVSMRFITAPNDWDATRQGITTGQSGDPTGKLYRSELDAWYKGATPVFPFNAKAVMTATQEKLVLQPE